MWGKCIYGGIKGMTFGLFILFFLAKVSPEFATWIANDDWIATGFLFFITASFSFDEMNKSYK